LRVGIDAVAPSRAHCCASSAKLARITIARATMAASSQGTCTLYSLPVSRRFANAFCLPGTTSVLRHLDLEVSDHRRFASRG
jgi:hypothetical protein